MKLDRASVRDIHLEGGSVLGTSRGGGDVKRIVDSMQAMGINALFVLGGNGTHAGAQAIYQECEKRSYECAVVGVPKTIDNDILHVRLLPTVLTSGHSLRGRCMLGGSVYPESYACACWPVNGRRLNQVERVFGVFCQRQT